MTQRLLGRQRDEAKTGALAADLAKIERDLSLWYARHDEAAVDAEKEAAWRPASSSWPREDKILRQRLAEQVPEAGRQADEPRRSGSTWPASRR